MTTIGSILLAGFVAGGWYGLDYKPWTQQVAVNACMIAEMQVDQAQRRLWDRIDRVTFEESQRGKANASTYRAKREADAALERAKLRRDKVCR